MGLGTRLKCIYTLSSAHSFLIKTRYCAVNWSPELSQGAVFPVRLVSSGNIVGVGSCFLNLFFEKRVCIVCVYTHLN